MKTLGVFVLVLGVIMTMVTGFNLVTKKEVAEIGPIEISKEEKKPIYWSPITGGVLIVAGVVILVAGKKTVT